ncbi:HD domain-containing protein [Pseudomonas frederiksbergensis]|uniref:Chaperone protein HtpG n=1 Tax=Pseudomonas frederiksbergensis TaxID=104087 RepID=A0A6L5BXL5_9PSED|nr:ATP-binding protein [Pseudomonas frederiksbergensis]KAF2392107.1 Chaperone protein HtpG [Pseudomonas frederiksbergensis]
MEDFQKSPLWKKSFAEAGDGFEKQRQLLTTAFLDFRERVSLLVGQIHKDMPSLTVHDITHLDSLWWTASEIAGADYPLNPAEAFVLGGAFLLHDSAHCVAAYPGGIEEIQRLPEWQHFSAEYRKNEIELKKGTDEFQLVLFEVLRTLHPLQARRLPIIHWQAPGESTPLYLLQNDELRNAYGSLIGEIAESHWSYPHELERFNHFKVNPPVCLHPAPWTVDVLKISVLLRTADAAHIDAKRAPRFLSALVQPGGTSLTHWKFQSRMHEVKLDSNLNRNDLRVSGTPFPEDEQDAWWMAYDTARMIDGELQAADRLLIDLNRDRLAARSVAFSYSPEAFSRNVPTEGWQPVDTSIKITDIQTMVSRFGGEKLYGKKPSAALKEILQNAVDAIHACRSLGGLGEDEGEIEVSIDDTLSGHWLHITDTGIGMSRYVLTNVLLDFGRSLWRSGDLRGEWQELKASGFEAIGQFGIGFFSIFMLGDKVKVLTRRYENKSSEKPEWLMEFTSGTNKRPVLRPPRENERLKRHGTRVSVFLGKEKMDEICQKKPWQNESKLQFESVLASLLPCVDINIFIRKNSSGKINLIKANDWIKIHPTDLIQRMNPEFFQYYSELSKHLTEIKDANGRIKGRLSVEFGNDIPDYFNTNAIGSIKGVYAGTIQGLYGIIESKAQEDLARNKSSPNVNSSELAIWAEVHKEHLVSENEIDTTNSSILYKFGASPSGLIIGHLNGKPISYEDFLVTSKTTKDFVIHEGQISYDDEMDDDILRREFEIQFTRDFNLLEVSNLENPDWLDDLYEEEENFENRDMSELIFELLEKTWGKIFFVQDYARVGTVSGVNVLRICSIPTEKDPNEGEI